MYASPSSRGGRKIVVVEWKKKKNYYWSETHEWILVTDAAPFSRGPLIGLDQRNTRTKQVSFCGVKISITAIAVIENGGEKWWIRQDRWWEFQLHSQEGQDFSAAAAASRLITHKGSESRSLDLTNNGMGNHYLTDVDHGSHCVARHRTASLTYMSE